MQSENSVLFLIGQNSRGQWVAQKQHGRCGGLFVSHAAALKYALHENGNRREAVISVPGVLELDLGGRTFAVHHAASRADVKPLAAMTSRSRRPGIAQAA